jgi:CheY-like chemotaxis protein
MNVKSKPTILLIDDEKDILLTIGDFLNNNGYTTLTAMNGEEALRLLETNKPDLIILDINMPKMNGLAFLAHIQEKPLWDDIPVYVFTGRANMEQYFEEVSVAGFMAKPCLPDKLLADIKNILTKRTLLKAESKKGGKFKLLLVEPDASRHSELTEQFTHAGFKVITPLGVGDVVQTALTELPDGIMMQMFMDGMNGTQIASILRMIPATRDLPILIYDDTVAGRMHTVPQNQGDQLQNIVINARNKDLLPLMQQLMQKKR